MLYISRIMDDYNIGVCDTDDNVEEKVDMMYLYEMVSKHGITVEGYKFDSRTMLSYSHVPIEPQQEPNACTAKQARLKTLQGVDLRTFRGEITYIHLTYKYAKERVRIVPSEYAERMSWFCPIKWDRNLKNSKRLVLVLDDKIEMIKRPQFRNVKVIYDISAVSDCRMVDEIYGVLLQFKPSGWSSFLIDGDKRMHHYMDRASYLRHNLY